MQLFILYGNIHAFLDIKLTFLVFWGILAFYSITTCYRYILQFVYCRQVVFYIFFKYSKTCSFICEVLAAGFSFY